MPGQALIAIALFILLLTPIAALTVEGRRVPDGCYLLLALGGLAHSVVTDGVAAMMLSGTMGMLCLLTLTAAITVIRSKRQIQLMAGSQIKLVAAGAAWLSEADMLPLLLLALPLLASGKLLRARKGADVRPIV